MKTVVTMFALAVFLGAALAEEALPTKDQVLQRFVEAVGGGAALEGRDEVWYSGTIVQDLAWKEPSHTETPFCCRASDTGWLSYVESADWADLPPEDTNEPALKLRWVMHPSFATQVEDFFPDLEVVRRETRAGRSVIVLAPADLKFEHYALYFDEETGLLNHIGYHNDLTDWREVDGVLCPHTFVFGRKGGHTTYEFEEVSAKD